MAGLPCHPACRKASGLGSSTASSGTIDVGADLDMDRSACEEADRADRHRSRSSSARHSVLLKLLGDELDEYAEVKERLEAELGVREALERELMESREHAQDLQSANETCHAHLWTLRERAAALQKQNRELRMELERLRAKRGPKG